MGAGEKKPAFRPGVRLGLDWGDARIGVAACDRDGLLAFGVGRVTAGAGELADLLALVTEYQPVEIVVGLPRSLSGGEGPAAAKIRDKAVGLLDEIHRAGHRIDVRMVDERLTTVSAARSLREAGRRARQHRSVIDQTAAATILEHALSIERSTRQPPGELVSPESEGGGPRELES